MRTVSVLHPTAEDSAQWAPQSAGEGTRRVLESLAVIALALPDAESRIWPMTTQHVDRCWTRALKTAGVSYRKPHTLRHSWISILLSRGAPLLYLVKGGGWASATVPLRAYAKWVPDGAIVVESAQPAQHPSIASLR